MSISIAILLIAQLGKLAPVSDAPREPGFPAYLSRLKTVVAKRDGRGLRKLVDPDVIVGGFADKDEKGWGKFVLRWAVDDKESPLWDVLADLIELGFFREAPATLVSPYVAWKFPRELDPADHLVVLRDALALRATPDRDGKVVAMLAFDIVKRVEAAKLQSGFDWILVETSNGTRGYVQASNVKSPLMPRAQFGKREGQWCLVVLDRGRD